MTTIDGNANHRHSPARAMLLLGLAYPLAAHVAVVTGRPALISASIGLLVVLLLLPGLHRGRPLAWTLLLLAGAGLYASASSERALLLLFLPPIVLNGFMAWVFGHTLRPGRTPLIERLVRLMHGPEDPPGEEIVAYARRVTQAWAGLFVVLTALNLLLATLARPGGLLLAAGFDPTVTVPLEAWSLFANVLNYLFVAALFVVEYAVRRRRFPQRPHRSLADFTRRLAALGDLFRPAARSWGPRHRPRRRD